MMSRVARLCNPTAAAMTARGDPLRQQVNSQVRAEVCPIVIMLHALECTGAEGCTARVTAVGTQRFLKGDEVLCIEKLVGVGVIAEMLLHGAAVGSEHIIDSSALEPCLQQRRPAYFGAAGTFGEGVGLDAFLGVELQIENLGDVAARHGADSSKAAVALVAER